MVCAQLHARLVNAHNGSVPRGTRLPLVPDQEMLKHGVDAFVLRSVEFRILVKRHVSGSTNFPYFAEHLDDLVFQSVEFCAHIFRSGGWPFYGSGFSSTRVFSHTGVKDVY
jgi:hypothetical protein